MVNEDETGVIKDGWHRVDANIDSLRDWRRSFAHMNSLITTRLHMLKGELPATSENELWHNLAPQFDGHWKNHEVTLRRAERELHVMETEQKPLGAIGRALEGDRVQDALDSYNHALAGFVLLDESLRTKAEARETLDVMVTQIKDRLHLIERMEKTTRELLALNQKLEPFLSKDSGSGEIPDIQMVGPDECISNEHLLEKASHLTKTAEQAIKGLHPSSAPEPSLTSLFKTFARRSLASLRRSNPLKSEM